MHRMNRMHRMHRMHIFYATYEHLLFCANGDRIRGTLCRAIISSEKLNYYVALYSVGILPS